MNSFACEMLEDGWSRLVRHGHLPEREVMTGIGPVPVKVPRIRDRGDGEDKTASLLLGPRQTRGGSVVRAPVSSASACIFPEQRAASTRE